jgi:hypothetical protein
MSQLARDYTKNGFQRDLGAMGAEFVLLVNAVLFCEATRLLRQSNRHVSSRSEFLKDTKGHALSHLI